MLLMQDFEPSRKTWLFFYESYNNKHKRKTKNMIFLIGGSPRGGKSILGRRLAKKLNIGHLSTDNIRPIVIPYFPKRDFLEKFPFENMLIRNDFEKFFKKYSGQEMLRADIKEARTIWPGVRNLIEYLLKCEMDYVIEGAHLLPSLVRKFKNNKNIKIIFLTKKDERRIYEGFIKNKNRNDWVTDNIRDEEIIVKAAKAMADYYPYFVRETEKYHFKMINTDTNFKVKIEEGEMYLIS
jgi:2-phosphoglycerate kinase